ncbi:MAG: twin-arginine translocase TatA/TatE family subunit [Ornithinimicrobium sp.]|uniref:twin-arginine translocase TatA/TatE family subunit n=1 Tax=Ornithinimicrobium sp. TaxID=1977084 RepID=UPI001799EBD1|nr:Sec-independent protein translocase TatB [Actinomycetota bacterium]
MFNLQATEIFLLLVLAVVILGPHRLPEYAAKLAQAVRSLRDLAEGAKSQIKEEMGPAFDDVNWQQLDPRQYDPRRIVRDALAAPNQGSSTAGGRRTVTTAEAAGMRPVERSEAKVSRPTRTRSGRPARQHDPGAPTPFDTEAT